jgi:hypothetical protein
LISARPHRTSPPIAGRISQRLASGLQGFQSKQPARQESPAGSNR